MNAVWVVLRKELVDGVRDHRSLLSAILFPLFGPVLIALLFTQVIERHRTVGAVELARSRWRHGV